MKRSIHLVIAGSLLVLQLSVIFSATAVHANGDDQQGSGQAGGKAQTTAQAPPNNAAGYTFVADPGCSLSLLTRRALQLFDSQKEDVSLTPAAAMYAETNIVQRLGSRQLNVGERVTIDQALLEEYAQRSKALSPDRLAAWQTYANRADFNVDYIKPVSSGPAANAQPAQPPADAQKDQVSKQESDRNNPADRRRLPALWWVVGLAALAALYYLLNRRRPKT